MILTAQILSINVLITKLRDPSAIFVEDDILVKDHASLDSDIQLKNEQIRADRPL